MLKVNDCYKIDTIIDPDTDITLYYVYREEKNKRTIVNQPFYTYGEAEILMEELNENLLECS